MIVIIDNYDSFVFNIARYFVELGAAVRVLRNDAVDAEAVAALAPSAIVLSPGPCGPREAGQSMAILRHFHGRLPILGICLGHQCIGEMFGGSVVRAREPMHGRASAIHHDGSGLFGGLPSPFQGGRYHSLTVALDDAQSELRITARADNGEIMGLAHRRAPTFGVQFHPESVLSQHGHALLRNFLTM